MVLSDCKQPQRSSDDSTPGCFDLGKSFSIVGDAVAARCFVMLSPGDLVYNRRDPWCCGILVASLSRDKARHGFEFVVLWMTTSETEDDIRAGTIESYQVLAKL